MKAGHKDVPQDIAFLSMPRHWVWVCFEHVVHCSSLPLLLWQMVQIVYRWGGKGFVIVSSTDHKHGKR